MILKDLIYGVSRFFPAFMLLLYGGSKFLGTQFGISEYIADLPMSQLNGFQLTWYYFDYSTYYGYFLASVQVSGALLLLIRRTTLLAIVTLLPVMLNIVLINIFYGITEGALFMSLLITGFLLVAASFHFRELKKFFWSDQIKNMDRIGSFRWKTALHTVIKSTVILVPIIILLSVQSQQTPKSPFEGVWDVSEWSSENETPNRIYFETMTTHSAMFRYQNFRRQYGFQYDAEDLSVRLFLRKIEGPEDIFEGNYELKEERLHFRGKFLETDEFAEISLTKVR